MEVQQEQIEHSKDELMRQIKYKAKKGAHIWHLIARKTSKVAHLSVPFSGYSSLQLPVPPCEPANFPAG